MLEQKTLSIESPNSILKERGRSRTPANSRKSSEVLFERIAHNFTGIHLINKLWLLHNKDLFVLIYLKCLCIFLGGSKLHLQQVKVIYMRVMFLPKGVFTFTCVIKYTFMFIILFIKSYFKSYSREIEIYLYIKIVQYSQMLF